MDDAIKRFANFWPDFFRRRITKGNDQTDPFALKEVAFYAAEYAKADACLSMAAVFYMDGFMDYFRIAYNK